MDRIDVCSVWTSFGRYFYKSVPKMTTGCKKPEFSKPHYNAVFSSLQKNAKTLSGSSTPVSGTRRGVRADNPPMVFRRRVIFSPVSPELS